MESLGEDIVLLALRADGRLRVWDRLRFALGGTELVRLVESGLIDIVDGLLVVAEADGQPAPTGDGPADQPADPMLRAAFEDIKNAKRPPQAGKWVAARPQRVVDAYLARLDAAGAVRTVRRRMLGLTVSTRWYVVDQDRQAAVRARLDEIALRDPSVAGHGQDPAGGAAGDAAHLAALAGVDGGEERNGPDLERAALAGLVNAIGLAKELYRGSGGQAACERLAAAGRLEALSGLATHLAGDAILRAIQQANEIALHSAIEASIDAAHAATAHHAATGGVHAGGGGHH